MAEIQFKGSPIHTVGTLPAVGSPAPAFTLTGIELKDFSLSDFAGKRVILNIFPSVDTGVCAASVRRFNQEAAKLSDTVVINASFDLPFAQKRFCGAEGIEKVMMGSGFRHREFAERYGVTMTDGPLAGLMSRAVVVIDASGKVAYTEQVGEVTQEPNYEQALGAVAVHQASNAR